MDPRLILTIVTLLTSASPIVDYSVGDSIYPNSVAYSIEQIGEYEREVANLLSDEDIIDERLTEYEVMVSSGELAVAEETLTEALAELEELETDLTQEEVIADTTATTEDELELATKRQRLMERLMKHQHTLEQVRAYVSTQAQSGIDQAISSTESHIARANTRFDELEAKATQTQTQTGATNNVVLQFENGRATYQYATQSQQENQCRLGVKYPKENSCLCSETWAQECAGDECGYVCRTQTQAQTAVGGQNQYGRQ